MPAKSSEHLSRGISEHILKAPSLAKLIDGYLIGLKSEGKSPKTIAYYDQQLRNFLWWCEQGNAPTVVERITTTHLRQFLIYVKSEPVRWGGRSTSSRKPVSQSTLQHYHQTLSTFFKWLEAEGLISGSPMTNVKKPKAPRRLVQAFSQEEIQRLLSLCNGQTFLDARNKAILMLFLDTGLRVSEVCGLRLLDVDSEQGIVLVRKGKGQRQRTVRMGNRCQRAVWRWVTLFRNSYTDSLFVSQHGETLRARGVKILVERLCKKAGVFGGGGCHRLRHTFAIEFLRAGGDVMSLQYLLGHSSLDMVKRYLGSLNADDAARAHKRFSPMDRMEVR